MEHEIILSGTVTVPIGAAKAEGRYIHEDVVKAKDEEIKQLRYKITGLRREIASNQKALQRKSKELDALGITWCSGGCETGMGRYTQTEVTEEMVKFLERNAERARTHFSNRQCKVNRAKREKCKTCQTKTFEQCKRMAEQEDLDAELGPLTDKKTAQCLADETEYMVGDPKALHFYADKFLCDILKSHGYVDTVYLFETMEKLYG